MTVSDTPEDAAPMNASTSSASRRSTVAFATSPLSPESPGSHSTSAPLTPPAALISATASSTPANSGGPRNARLPVSGSKPPRRSTPSPAVSAAASSAGSSAAGSSAGSSAASSLPPQAPATRARPTTSAPKLRARVFIIGLFPPPIGLGRDCPSC